MWPEKQRVDNVDQVPGVQRGVDMPSYAISQQKASLHTVVRTVNDHDHSVSLLKRLQRVSWDEH